MLLDANGALLLAAMGVLLICAEFCLPGWVAPGVAGGMCVVCGAYRLAALDANVWGVAALLAALATAAICGYGWAPEWIGWGAIAAVPWLCRMLVPGAIQWTAAGLAALAPAAVFLLLRVAARAALNKTLLQ